MTVRAALARTAEMLAARGVDTPSVDAELLLAHILGLSRTALLLSGERELLPDGEARLAALAERRGRREPLAYILGSWGFRRLELKVDRRALIPRPETETVVERCLALLRDRQRPLVLDVGVGSGAIALALADEHEGAAVTAIDLSADALELARGNAERSGLQVQLLEHDLRNGLPGGPYDLVVSNPPYVEPADLNGLMPDVRDYEPHVALVGVGATEAIARGARDVLRPDAWLVLEVGDGQAPRTLELLAALGYGDGTITLDLTGRERVVEGRR